MIRRHLLEAFAREPRGNVDADLCVAMGELYPYHCVPVIASNTPIPVRKSEAFFTVVDDQTAVDVRIYQGEKLGAPENIQIGEFRLVRCAAPA